LIERLDRLEERGGLSEVRFGKERREALACFDPIENPGRLEQLERTSAAAKEIYVIHLKL